ncbi:FG-GAP-like repeat-containing protein [Micromonospora halophytica]|uniref:Repeat domain-containing protein n=1 Tax=Micromonospora halophytica TaxID=47864 RepID=A0A1C5IVI1_9ACTN|nr:FG-GAP-like repeat-containing protein [Micromonospora halophytica]SCG62325.1 Repeat domain-containing protein [Micromonospora halophytica]
MSTRSIRHSASALLALVVLAALALATPAAAAGPRPLFQLPFQCGETWKMATYDGHGSYKIDFTHSSGNSLGRPIIASAGGTVSFSGWGSSGGWWVRIDHGGGWQTDYLHMRDPGPAVRQGQSVAIGQLLGYVGSTGNSTGPHLHYVQYADGVRTEAYFNGVRSGMTGDSSPDRWITSANCGSSTPRDTETISDWSGDGYADVLGVDSVGDLYYYPNNKLSLSARTKIGHGWSTYKHVMADDWSGDGHADVLAVDSVGDLYYYPNNNLGLSTRTKLGHGWGTFKHVMAADWSGDGQADVLGVDSVGDLYYYPNNNLGLSTRTKIGNGWGTFKHVMAADWSGDGQADVLGVDSSGYLWYYPHNGTGLSSPVQIGNGWGTFKHVFASDFSGDGQADVLGVNASGELWYYPHWGTGFGTPVKLGHGWGTYPFVM